MGYVETDLFYRIRLYLLLDAASTCNTENLKGLKLRFTFEFNCEWSVIKRLGYDR